ncbi:hypothetical protein N658DRAFT_12866 [Parathielavia hyrcaniae]|uniref:Uncharacterized protein n=1 Tax=Parathielavia hyrcaniae TaxID=113614 RepID=A0AAN6Q9U6_9PEZI|nr:hypothetical protein N658DRAFT_12866 [Parathielavia hyrcaniae]
MLYGYEIRCDAMVHVLDCVSVTLTWGKGTCGKEGLRGYWLNRNGAGASESWAEGPLAQMVLALVVRFVDVLSCGIFGLADQVDQNAPVSRSRLWFNLFASISHFQAPLSLFSCPPPSRLSLPLRPWKGAGFRRPKDADGTGRRRGCRVFGFRNKGCKDVLVVDTIWVTQERSVDYLGRR